MANRTKLLVADDERVVRHVCQLTLERSDCEVLTAENGLLALELLRTHPGVEIVLTDLKMPAMDGMELLKTIKRDFPHLEVIIMTGYATIEVAVAALKLGAFDFLLKPLKADQIRLAVAKCREKIQLSQENLLLKRANEKLRELQVMKDKFIAIASHELRTPVSHLKGYLAILNEARPNELSEAERAECMQILQTAVADVEQIVTDMTNLLYLEHKIWQLRRERVDLAAVITQVVQEFRLPARARGLNLNWQTTGRNCSLTADRLKIKLMLAELVQNAIKFTPDGGTIDIALTHDHEFWVITVQDNGVGIPAEELGKIFEKFYEVQNSDLHSSSATGFLGGGLGIGLPLARAIAEAHGGGIKVSSVPHQGSTFQVLLPMTTSATPARPAEPGFADFVQSHPAMSVQDS
ncbi:MAG: HAMP domain-containing histidine kinase [candidate division KSB1 bacterium]|nr:HAMP domain-containing histidine kinase [candidate division KSB1 bacterium]MDZ7273118.1 HAMP domain-containing histidine kinase [candidate division KSB1 bacterium]MDZ7285220.1 HAMP domain-containing histidine kinase [candidate division KSB1 bacterium]MDZ7298252.1 HAMP domain-containing histidine kinase [candidate division KSB1 bacterium]MDZ7308912.1 HAMP domain-containing histidine kinase [candidate division KSB1 bacterium]